MKTVWGIFIFLSSYAAAERAPESLPSFNPNSDRGKLIKIMENPQSLSGDEEHALTQRLAHTDEPKENKWLILQILIKREEAGSPMLPQALLFIEGILNDIFEGKWPWSPLKNRAARRLGFIGSRYALSERSLNNLIQTATAENPRNRGMKAASLEALKEISDAPIGSALLSDQRALQIKEALTSAAEKKRFQDMVHETLQRIVSYIGESGACERSTKSKRIH